MPVIYQRDFSNLNEEELLAEVQAINWEEVLPSAPDVNLIFDSFHAKITEIVDKHAPLRKLSKKEMQLRAKPWITKGLKAAIAIKNKLYKSYLKFKNDYYFSKYKPYRNNLKHLVISPNESTASPKARRTSQRGLLELRLQNESQELEIKKLELQLQLVQLQTSHPTTTSHSDPAAKSLGGLKAPQRMVSPQQWPHIFAPGEPKLHNDLSLPEFSAGFLVIVQCCEDPTLQTTLLAHFHDLMVLACNYRWSAVLAFHYKVLRSIEMGLVS